MKILVENCQKININDLVRGIKTEVATLRLKEKLGILNQEIKITQTSCNFVGYRFWFSCPKCGRKAGILYKTPISEAILCRKCHSLKYMKSRFHKMM